MLSKKFFMHYFGIFLNLVTALSIAPAYAAPGDELPTIDPKFVSIQVNNPARDAGYVVGDIIAREITLTIKKPYELVKESLPIVGYEHRYKGQISGIELYDIQSKETSNVDSVTHQLNLKYQVFTTGRVAKPGALRAEIIKIRNTEKKEIFQYRIPLYNIRISPLSVFGQVKLLEEMSPFTPPFHISAQQEKTVLNISIVILVLSLIGLLYILGMRTWLPRMGAPFAKAYRDIRNMPESAEGLQQAVARVHQALNKTASTSLFNDNLPAFLMQKPAFAPMQQEIERFFQLSRFTFFESNNQQTLANSSKQWLLDFCKHMRDCERGLVPNIQTKVGA
jgi:mxaA protein